MPGDAPMAGKSVKKTGSGSTTASTAQQRRVDSAAKVNSSVIRNGAAPSSVDSSVLRGAPTGTSVRKAGEARAIDRGQSREVPTVSIPEQERDEDDSFEAALARIQAAEQEFLRSQNGAR